MSSADFVERRNPTHFRDARESAVDARDALVAKGCTWFRFYTSPTTRRLIVEGWKVRPDDEGPLPEDELP